MSGRRDHRDLIVWQRAMSLALKVYRDTDSFPSSELFGLRSQLRRSAVSVASNIAEGGGRRTTKDFVAFLHVARGSLAELETQMLLSYELRFLASTWQEEINEVGRLLNAVIRGLNRKMAAAQT